MVWAFLAHSTGKCPKGTVVEFAANDCFLTQLKVIFHLASVEPDFRLEFMPSRQCDDV